MKKCHASSILAHSVTFWMEGRGKQRRVIASLLHDSLGKGEKGKGKKKKKGERQERLYFHVLATITHGNGGKKGGDLKKVARADVLRRRRGKKKKKEKGGEEPTLTVYDSWIRKRRIAGRDIGKRTEKTRARDRSASFASKKSRSKRIGGQKEAERKKRNTSVVSRVSHALV